MDDLFDTLRGSVSGGRSVCACYETHVVADALIFAGMTAADAAVLSDALLERGDKYGEFIALSLRGDPTAENVRRRHEKKWLGPLAEFLQDIEYECGMPRTAVVNRKAGEATAEALEHPLLRTIRKLTMGKTAKTRVGRTHVTTYVAFARAMVSHALCEIDAADGQLAMLADYGELFTHLHDVRILDKATQRALRDPRWRAVRWVELRAPARLFVRVIDVLRADENLFRRNRPDVVMHFTTAGQDESAYLRAAFPDLPVESFLLWGRLRFHRVDGEMRIEEIEPPPPPPEVTLAMVNGLMKRDNPDGWRVLAIDDGRISCERKGYTATVELVVAPTHRELAPVLLAMLDALDLDGAHAIVRTRDALITEPDALVAHLQAHRAHPKLDWPGFVVSRYVLAPVAPSTRALLAVLPEVFASHARTIALAAIEHDLPDDARQAVANLTEKDLTEYGHIRTRARSARMKGETELADRFDRIVGGEVSLPPERFR